MDDVESKFLETKSLQLLIWFRYTDDVLQMCCFYGRRQYN